MIRDKNDQSAWRGVSNVLPLGGRFHHGYNNQMTLPLTDLHFAVKKIAGDNPHIPVGPPGGDREDAGVNPVRNHGCLRGME